MEIDLTFSVDDTSAPPVSNFTIARGENRDTIQRMIPADFSNPPPGVEVIPLSPTDTTYSDQAVSEGVHYFYKLLACDSAPVQSCGMSAVVQGDAGPVPLNVSLGSLVTIFDAPPQACTATTGFDIPDVCARAQRRSDGSILLISGNSRGNFFEEGPDFTHLQRNCSTPAPLDSNFTPDPSQFDYQRWIVAAYREVNSPTPNRMYALVHHEFHDHDPAHTPPCPVPNNGCVYYGITLAYSDDGGRSYTQPPAPTRLVAELPYPWDYLLSNMPGIRPPPNHGYAAGTNIIRAADGYYYALTTAVYDPLNFVASGITCLMRTNDLSDPQSWRFWDGHGFNHQTRNPYVNGVSYATAMADLGQYICAPIDSNANGMALTLTFNTYLGMYLMVGERGDPANGVPCGFYYVVSHDLLHWSIARLFRPGNLPWCDVTIPQDVYPSLIDHQDTSVNFEHTDERFYLYFVHYVSSTDRDLVRQFVRITRQ
jgi:hypothetical protein